MRRYVPIVLLVILIVETAGICNAQFVEDDRRAYFAEIDARNAVIRLAAEGDLEGYKAAIAKNPAALNFRWQATSKAEEFYGETSLHFAAMNNDLPMLDFLLASNADIHQRTVTGNTPLHYAASERVAERLIGAGAKVNARGNHGLTPLHMAATKQVAEVLVDNGASISERDDGIPSFQGKASEGMTPLHVAVRDGRLEVIVYLIEQGADVNATSNGTAAICHASGRHLEIVKLLLAQGARVNDFEPHRSPLKCAVENGQTEIVKLLLTANADPMLESGSGWSLLHFAASRSDCEPELIETLLDSGLESDKVDVHNRTPLHAAARSGNLVAARVLLSNGANPLKLDTSGDTSLTLSRKVEEPEFYLIQGTMEMLENAQQRERRRVQLLNERRAQIAKLIELQAKK